MCPVISSFSEVSSTQKCIFRFSVFIQSDIKEMMLHLFPNWWCRQTQKSNVKIFFLQLTTAKICSEILVTEKGTNRSNKLLAINKLTRSESDAFRQEKQREKPWLKICHMIFLPRAHLQLPATTLSQEKLASKVSR